MADIASLKSEKGSASLYMLSGCFRFKKLQEAHLLAEFLAEACPNPRLAIMGITEILVNALEHGNLGISFEEKSKLQLEENWLDEIDKRLNLPEHINQFVEVEYRRMEKTIEIKVTDQGEGFDWKKFQDPVNKTLLSTHGRGILLAKSLAFSKLEYSEKGNVVTGTISLLPS